MTANIHFFYHTSLSSYWNEKYFRKKKDLERIKTYMSCSMLFPRKSCRLWNNVGK